MPSFPFPNVKLVYPNIKQQIEERTDGAMPFSRAIALSEIQTA